jgi:hypothetical protein
MGYNVPEILIDGLAVTEKLLEKKSETLIPDEEKGGNENG